MYWSDRRSAQKIDFESQLTSANLSSSFFPSIKEFRPVVLLFQTLCFTRFKSNLEAKLGQLDLWPCSTYCIFNIGKFCKTGQKLFLLQKLFSNSLWQNNLRLWILELTDAQNPFLQNLSLLNSLIHEGRAIGYQIG